MKKISEVYNETQQNKVKDSKTYSMPMDEFVNEHTRLIKILREGSREELLAEAESQEEELEKVNGEKEESD